MSAPFTCFLTGTVLGMTLLLLPPASFSDDLLDDYLAPECRHAPEYREPASRADMGWEVSQPPGGGWLPDAAYNRAGTFLRKRDRLFFLDSVGEDSWQALRGSFLYGGVLPAAGLTALYTVLYGASALGILSSGGAFGHSLMDIGRGAPGWPC